MWRFRQRIISVWVFPSASRLVTYSLVRVSVRIRVVAMRQSALLAWRLPPRLRRCRMVCPDDACTGLEPHSAAKDRSDFIRPGLSPAATSRAAAVSGPTPSVANNAGFAFAQRRRISTSSSAISVSRDWYRRARVA